MVDERERPAVRGEFGPVPYVLGQSPVRGGERGSAAVHRAGLLTSRYDAVSTGELESWRE
jgi:hypothetical protein